MGLGIIRITRMIGAIKLKRGETATRVVSYTNQLKILSCLRTSRIPNALKILFNYGCR